MNPLHIETIMSDFLHLKGRMKIILTVREVSNLHQNLSCSL